MKNIYKLFLVSLVVLILASCNRDPNDPGLEFAPQMYVSVPYEPFTQVKDHPFNPMGLNVRQPAKGTVPRRWSNMNERDRYESMLESDSNGVANDLMFYDIPSGQKGLEYAAANLKNPLIPNKTVLAEGQRLYEAYCAHCHGKQGDGKGPVSKKYNGIANLKAKTEMNHGHIFHVITHGKGLMWPHGSQVNPAERWKIVHYIKSMMHGASDDAKATEEDSEKEETAEGADTPTDTTTTPKPETTEENK